MSTSLYRILWLGASLSLVIANGARAECEVPNLPQEFTLNEQIIALSTEFDISSNLGGHGTVAERILSLTTTFDYTDDKGNRLATAKKAILTWGTQIRVYDCEGKKVGTIKEKVFESLFSVKTVYSILDKYDREVATSTKVDLTATSFTLKDASGRKVATLDRPFLRITDKWNVKVHDASAVDMRLLVMIGAYKTAADNERD